MSAVSLSRNGVVATLTLDRPEARNALEPAMMVELRDLVTALPPSRIVAMSFCEPRSCRLQLSS